MRYSRINNKTIFYTQNQEHLIELLTSAGIKDITFVEGKSDFTLHLNKRLTDEQVKRFKYYANKDIVKIKKHQSEIPKIFHGFKGCLVTGFDLKYLI